ncbi:alpha-N-acetylneuraminide alpha-2,8-sialyltransferase-like isoform X2 [Anneissia japonica]|uniref:alpha-N-acetylneuraminide alpha-2,8-sialyltransferase-like isoform X2 n=1 Tax=Anneissia japonica TaxID=1529436 RepID=UPI0014258C02|nr:alpha-N-acetylneuraminide alpha-2,8-sialyltransferase-like isoform X2 [Anneissia japonica]
MVNKLVSRWLKCIILLNAVIILILYSVIPKWNDEYSVLPARAVPDQNFQHPQTYGINSSSIGVTDISIPNVNATNMYVIDFGNETRFNFGELLNLLKTPWKNNISYILQFRHDLSSFTESLRMLFVTKESTKLGSKLQYVWTKYGKVTINHVIFKYLPKNSPFTGNYTRCSLVGNSGILTNSRCGSDIDKSDFIIRCNAPPIKAFAEDAGKKSNLTTVNPSILRRTYNKLRTRKDHWKYLNGMLQYNMHLWLPTFAANYNVDLCLRADRMMKTSKKYPVHILHGHPQHFTEVMNFWKQRGINKSITTGFYMTNLALQLCNEVHLYGFWPFHVDLYNKEVPYHYFDDTQLGIGKTFHNISSEFKALLELHKAGALRLHLRC